MSGHFVPNFEQSSKSSEKENEFIRERIDWLLMSLPLDCRQQGAVFIRQIKAEAQHSAKKEAYDEMNKMFHKERLELTAKIQTQECIISDLKRKIEKLKLGTEGGKEDEKKDKR